MRLEGQAKGGFFPCPVEAIEAVAQRVKRTAGVSAAANLFDPCAGEGDAICRLAALLGVAPGGVWAMELEDSRSATLVNRLPGSHVLGRVDFTVSEISSDCMSLVWLNPPFDSECGGGSREELTFLEKATHTLAAPGGILVFILPDPILSNNYKIKDHLLCHYDTVSVMPFPDTCRKYREVIVIARRRPGFVKGNPNDWLYVCQQHRDATYDLMASEGPRRFQSGGPCDSLIVEYVQASPLLQLLAAPRSAETGRPCLELEHGQMALVLAGGMLNGVIQLAGEEPFVVMATPYKESYVSSETEEERSDGEGGTVWVQVIERSERIRLKVRCLTAGGRIKDLV